MTDRLHRVPPINLRWEHRDPNRPPVYRPAPEVIASVLYGERETQRPLTDRERDVIDRTWRLRQPGTDIARDLGVSPQAVSKTLKRAERKCVEGTNVQEKYVEAERRRRLDARGENESTRVLPYAPGEGWFDDHDLEGSLFNSEYVEMTPAERYDLEWRDYWDWYHQRNVGAPVGWNRGDGGPDWIRPDQDPYWSAELDEG